VNESGPIIVTGMHRSGTSLLAALLSDMGVRMGEKLLAPDGWNRRGYFEDVDFVEFHRSILTEMVNLNNAGHPDWGWTESGTLDTSGLRAHKERARSLTAERSGLWGWKDPRTTLFLKFWDEVLERNAVYVLVYRFPWEVAESMLRLGASVFVEHPDYAWKIWTFYNDRLLDFYRHHRDRSILVSVNALLLDPERFGSLLKTEFGLQFSMASFDQVRDPELFASLPCGDPLANLLLAANPEAANLLAALEEEADLPAVGLWKTRPPDGELLQPDGQVDLSIVIPCFEQGEFLLEAVASVERAAPPRCELIVVNDGSHRPRTVETLDLLRNAKYRIISQPNAGVAVARNRGIFESRGRYILPLDADNRILPGFPAAAIQVLQANPKIGVVYGDRIEVGMRNQRVAVPEFDLGRLLWENYMDTCAAFRREVWEEAGGYDSGAAVWEDWDLWLGAAGRGWDFHRLVDPAFEYRVRPGSMSAIAETDGSRPAVRQYIYRKHRELYRQRFPAVLLFGHAELLAVRKGAEAYRLDRDRLQKEIDRLAESLTSRNEKVSL
jgi:glycosyltransferase involved in cell wall biosynthesis